MATGLEQGGGVMAPPDLGPGAGPSEWSAVSGIAPTHPLVGGPGWGAASPFDVDFGRSRVVTQHEDVQTAASGHQHWSELLNFSHSPLPWVALAALAVLGLMAIRVSGRVGPLSASAAVGK